MFEFRNALLELLVCVTAVFFDFLMFTRKFPVEVDGRDLEQLRWESVVSPMPRISLRFLYTSCIAVLISAMPVGLFGLFRKACSLSMKSWMNLMGAFWI